MSWIETAPPAFPGKRCFGGFAVAPRDADPYASGGNCVEVMRGLILVGAVAAVLAAGSAVASERPKKTDFAAAHQTARDNAKSEAGKKYEADFLQSSVQALRAAMVRCTRGAFRHDLDTFTILVSVAGPGRPERILVEPETRVAACVRKALLRLRYPQPPRSGWWVAIEMKMQ